MPGVGGIETVARATGTPVELSLTIPIKLGRTYSESSWAANVDANAATEKTLKSEKQVTIVSLAEFT
jgi:hypothetical protein